MTYEFCEEIECCCKSQNEGVFPILLGSENKKILAMKNELKANESYKSNMKANLLFAGIIMFILGIFLLLFTQPSVSIGYVTINTSTLGWLFVISGIIFIISQKFRI